MSLKDIYRKIIITSITATLMILFITGISYSAFNVNAKSEKQVLTFGDIKIDMCYNSSCSDVIDMGHIIGTKTENDLTTFIPQYPISDNEYMDKVVPYKFEVENTGNLDLYLSLLLEVDSSSPGGVIEEDKNLPTDAYINNENINSNVVQTFTEKVSESEYKYFKVALLEENTDTPLIKTLSSIKTQDNKLVNNISLNSKDKKVYSLYIWLSKEEMLSYENEENINSVIGKYLVTNISATGEYKPSNI